MAPPLKRKTPNNASPEDSLKKRKSIKTIACNRKMIVRVVLHTVECFDNIFFGYLSYGGRREGEGYYTKPLEDAYNQTILNNTNGRTSALYPNNPNSIKVCPGNVSMTDLFKFNYFVPRRETKESNIPKTVTHTKTFYWKGFIFIRPSNSKDNTHLWQLSDWTQNLKEQIINFADWTRSHPDVYSAYTFNFELSTQSRQEKEHLADEVLDSTVVQVIQSMYEITKEQALMSCNGENSLKDLFFGTDVTESNYKQRITNAWM